MLADPIAAAFTAAVVALTFFLCNVFEQEIADFLTTPILPPRLVRRVDPTVSLSPFGDPPFGISPAITPELATPEAATSEATTPGVTTTEPVTPVPVTPVSATPSSVTPEPATPEPTTPVSATPEPTSAPSPPATSVGAPPLPTPSSSSSAPTTTATGSGVGNPLSIDPYATNEIPHSAGVDEYHLYTGNGSISAGWPRRAQWMSYPEMFAANLPLLMRSCAIWDVTPNSASEMASIYHATLVISRETNTDPRFILAVVLQESGGCVRVPTSHYSTRNPGLMQSHNGPATCNEDATPVVPCPYAAVEEMIREGTAGTSYDTGMGLVEALREAGGAVDDVARYYRAARIYNSGSVDASGNLEMGIATHCYASDVANRLRGWVLALDICDGW